jgi:hypothetical protein
LPIEPSSHWQSQWHPGLVCLDADNVNHPS